MGCARRLAHYYGRPFVVCRGAPREHGIAGSAGPVDGCMRAITYAQFGSADVLELTEQPDPHIGPDTVVVRVKAASVNPVDWKIRAGKLQGLIDTELPAIPGWDVAGVVEQVGLDTPEFQVGDEVYGYVRKDTVHGGTFAELVAAPVRTLARKPASLSFEEAAAVPLAGLTAYETIQRAGVKEGQTVLVHAAAGGVGAFAVQIAKASGARVIGTASERNHEFLRGLGAEPVTYGKGLADRVRALAPDGVDGVLDFVGGRDVADSVGLLADGGTGVSSADPSARSEHGGHYVWVRPSTAGLDALTTCAFGEALAYAVPND